MLTPDQEKLKEAALAATQGPWRECGHDRGGCSCGMIWATESDELVAEAWKGDYMVPASTVAPNVNAAYIAAANPAAILAILAQLEQVQGDAAPTDELPMALDQLSAIVDALINKCADLRRIGNARNVKAAMPEGWTALSIVFDGDHDYPEEVAYGPPDMMARLGKKLDKYYADVIAKRDAATPSPSPVPAEVEVIHHPDDICIDQFAAAMKAKMAKQRAKGYGLWGDQGCCPTERLQTMLRDHIAKGDPVDVGNFAMMLHSRGERTDSSAQSGDEGVAK